MAVEEKRSPDGRAQTEADALSSSSGESEEKATSLFSGGAAAVLVMILLILVPIFYVLSIGPVVWLNDRNYIDVDENTAVLMFYAPLIYLHNYSPQLAAPLDWYVGLWESNSTPPAVPVTPAMPVPAPNPVPAPYTLPAPAASGTSAGPAPPAAAPPGDETAPDLPATSTPSGSSQ